MLVIDFKLPNVLTWLLPAKRPRRAAQDRPSGAPCVPPGMTLRSASSDAVVRIDAGDEKKAAGKSAGTGSRSRAGTGVTGPSGRRHAASQERAGRGANRQPQLYQALCAMKDHGRCTCHKRTPHPPQVMRRAVSLLVACRNRLVSPPWPAALISRQNGPTFYAALLEAPHSPFHFHRIIQFRSARPLSSLSRRKTDFAAREKFGRTKPLSYRYEPTGCRLGNPAYALTISSLRVAAGSSIALIERAAGPASSLEIHDATFAATK